MTNWSDTRWGRLGLMALIPTLCVSTVVLAGDDDDDDDRDRRRGRTFQLTILHNNDAESQLIDAGAGLEDFGGIARFATVVNNLRDEAVRSTTFGPQGWGRGNRRNAGPRNKGVIVLTSGDNILSGPEFNASLEAGVPYFDTIGLDLIGYDALCLGNHEFDFGPEILEAFLLGFENDVPFLSANLDYSLEPGLDQFVVDSPAQASGNGGDDDDGWSPLGGGDDDDDGGDDDDDGGGGDDDGDDDDDGGDDDDHGNGGGGNPSGAVLARSAIIEEAGERIGVVGAITDELRSISSPRDVIINAVAPAVQAEIDELRSRRINKIILISHLQSINEDLELLPLLSGVDVAIAGGGDEILANPGDLLVPGDETDVFGSYPLIGTDANGNDVPVITTSGAYKYVGRLVVEFDRRGRVVSINDDLSGPVRVAGGNNPDAVEPDPTVQALVTDPVADSVAALAANVIGTTDVELDGRRSQVRTVETNEGNLIADALLWQANQLVGDFGVPAAAIALQNGGGIRNDSILPVGDLTELDTFDILPFTNFVTLIPDIPREQFKEILENAVSRVEDVNGRFAQVAGFRFTWDPAGMPQSVDDDGNVLSPGNRVVSVELNDGTMIVDNGMVVAGPALNIATIDFLARGGDQYPYRGAPFTLLGVSYQQALRNYIQIELAGQVTGAQYPAGGEGRIIEQ